ncbi:hypothetical protein ONZ45_g2648 [Pleurotus djamor]|nr:hypothetical protein ONZ45_g2648 [Pleurotus djamor]
MDDPYIQCSLLTIAAAGSYYFLRSANSKIFPKSNPEIAFHEWSKQYGDVIHLSLMGRSIVVLNSLEAAVDLLEKRGAIYSDRPQMVVYDMMGWNPSLAFMPYGQRFKKHRSILQTHFTPEACIPYQEIQLQNVHLLVEGLMENQGNHDHLISRFTSSIAIRIAYGHQIRSDDDEYIAIANDAGAALRQGGAGGTLVDLFPILKHFPSWFPGAYFAGVARKWNGAIKRMYNWPYESIQKQVAAGTAKFSFVASEIDANAGRNMSEEEIDDIKGAAANIFAGGTETSWSSITTFFLAMLLYPECQRLAQQEIDRVIGPDRLPTFADRAALPYVNAVVQEVLRWKSVIPLGIPHRSTEDDTYRGMFIPKGSLVFANAMSMAVNEKTYKDSTRFYPARFLPKSQGGNGEPDFDPAFGFGRRICPGRHLATASIYITVATVFATLNLTKAKDQNGGVITPKLEFETGLTSHPVAFPCNIEARSKKASLLVFEAVQSID